MKTELEKWKDVRATWRKTAESISMLEHALSGKTKGESFNPFEEILGKGFNQKKK